MASLTIARALLRESLAAAERGDSLTAARMGLSALRCAALCRARGREDVALMGYDMAVGRAYRVLEDETASQPERSEAGRILAGACACCGGWCSGIFGGCSGIFGPCSGIFGDSQWNF